MKLTQKQKQIIGNMKFSYIALIINQLIMFLLGGLCIHRIMNNQQFGLDDGILTIAALLISIVMIMTMKELQTKLVKKI